MKNPDEDYAYGQWRQKLLDQEEVKTTEKPTNKSSERALERCSVDSNKPKIGSCSGVHRTEQFSHTDKWKDIPFVEPEAPKDGLLVLWGVCTALVFLFSAYLIWGPK